MADWADLDWAFQAPDYIQGELRIGYEALKLRMHAETEALLMPTTMQLIVERMIWYYIEMKYRERSQYGSPEGYLSPDHADKMFTRWQGCSNALVKAIKDYKEAERAALGAQARKALAEAIKAMPEAYRAEAAVRLTEALSNAGL